MNSSTPANIHQGLEIIMAHIIQEFMVFMKHLGLSVHQIHALMYIYHAGECQVSDIGVLADASNAAASQMVERLVQQGLVERREDPANRRAKILRLTGKGQELVRGSVTTNSFLTEMMASLTSKDRDTVQEAFRILARATQQSIDFNKPKDGYHAQNTQ